MDEGTNSGRKEWRYMVERRNYERTGRKESIERTGQGQGGMFIQFLAPEIALSFLLVRVGQGFIRPGGHLVASTLLD